MINKESMRPAEHIPAKALDEVSLQVELEYGIHVNTGAVISATAIHQPHMSAIGICVNPGNYALIIPKQLRDHLQAAGWSKKDIAAQVFERARIHRREWADVGKGAVVRDRGDSVYPAMESPEQLLVIAAGGPAGGFGAVIPPWLGHKSHAVTMAIGACLDCEPPKN